MEKAHSAETLKEKQRKNIKLVFLILVGIAAVSILALMLLNWLLPEKEEPAPPKIYFYPRTDENIFENSDYLALNRSVYYCDDPTGYGVTTQITEADRHTFDPEVQFAETYLILLTLGDRSTLRSLCTENYLKEQEIPDFSQQMIYDSYIYYHSTQGQEDGSRLVTYRLEYKIYQNNGSYRQDVGSDASKPEYLVLWVSPSGDDVKIENILRS